LRLPINLAALGFSLWLFRVHLFVVATQPSGQPRADFINGSIDYGLISWFWVQCLICAIVYAYQLVQHSRTARSPRFERPAAHAL
jgi:hypothetical protein